MPDQSTQRALTVQIAGWLLFFAGMGALALLLPDEVFDPQAKQFILLIGFVGVWRYSIGIIHFVRGMIFMYWRFPALRKRVDAMGDEGLPSKIYLLVTSFRIETSTTAQVYLAVLREAKASPVPVTIVASIVERSDEILIRSLFRKAEMPDTVQLTMVRIAGTGKRDGLAYGFRAISRDEPPADAVAAVIDGDTVLEDGCVRKCAPFFKLFPNTGALTTNEFCRVEGSHIMEEWHKLRFGQRHINMCSMAMSRRVLTLTGRMSMFRASVITDPDFIYDVQHDSIKHWRLGHFKFLTGDDKSSWFSIMKMGLDTFYVPDASIITVEHPPDPKFFRASRQLMYRWYGNNLRQNARAIKLGPKKLGWFTYYVIQDQRISMWTSLFGLASAIVASMKYSLVFFLIYFLWILTTRTLITFMVAASGHKIGPSYPVILYYNQIMGAMMKIYVYFRLDKQSWTRQPTKLIRDMGKFQYEFNRWSSIAMTFSSVSIFIAVVFAVIQ